MHTSRSHIASVQALNCQLVHKLNRFLEQSASNFTDPAGTELLCDPGYSDGLRQLVEWAVPCPVSAAADAPLAADWGGCFSPTAVHRPPPVAAGPGSGATPAPADRGSAAR